MAANEEKFTNFDIESKGSELYHKDENLVPSAEELLKDLLQKNIATSDGLPSDKNGKTVTKAKLLKITKNCPCNARKSRSNEPFCSCGAVSNEELFNFKNAKSIIKDLFRTLDTQDIQSLLNSINNVWNENKAANYSEMYKGLNINGIISLMKEDLESIDKIPKVSESSKDLLRLIMIGNFCKIINGIAFKSTKYDTNKIIHDFMKMLIKRAKEIKDRLTSKFSNNKEMLEVVDQQFIKINSCFDEINSSKMANPISIIENYTFSISNSKLALVIIIGILLVVLFFGALVIRRFGAGYKQMKEAERETALGGYFNF